ncbi:MAG: UDP-N-acetylmuramoyl-tripeptide--D-alanyl-D-alanine ligase [Candidatus Latescibacteria bacterium]|nr:UDP-N-acetylmuramoyl-tripeptide--D-alanyl-D-alanine ligase [Candidatus Latescibacterota bacterium]
MKPFTVKKLFSFLKQSAIALDTGIERFPEALLERNITGVSTDSRTIHGGEVFFAVRGEKFDGAEHVLGAFESGALCAVVNEDSMKEEFDKLAVIPVKDTIRALGEAASDYRSSFKATVVAVTGTTGKTTCREMMLAVLATRFHVHGTKGNYNNHIGMPLTVFGLDDSHECAVFELGMSAPGEIEYLAGIAKPDVGVILNVGPAHMELFSSVKFVADAKMELLDALDSEGTAVINGDDEHLKAGEFRSKSRLVRFGINRPWDYWAENLVVHRDGCYSFDVEGHNVKLNVPGLHTVYNALAAYTTGMLLGVASSEAVKALEAFTAPDKRMQIVVKNGISFINDSYNANPMSMKSAAEVLNNVSIPDGGRKIAVLGDMLELGNFSIKAHLNIGKVFAALSLEWLCFVGDNTAHYEQGALEGGFTSEKIRCFPDVKAASEFINDIKRPGDVILVKGSRAVGMENILASTGLQP